MRVLYLSHSCCIRVMKMGIAVINDEDSAKDVEVRFSQSKFSHPDFMYQATRLTLWDSPERMMVQLKNMSDIDLIHVHNEPTWIAVVAKRIRPDLPVILDCHDLDIVRGETGTIEEEREAFKVCDGFIFPSKGYQKLTYKHFRYQQPSEVVYSMVNRELMAPRQMTKLPGIVYQGGLGIYDDESDFNYRDITGVAEVLRDVQIPFHIYCGNTNTKIMEPYGDLGCLMHPRLHYVTLLQEQTRYDWGFLGAPGRWHQWDNSMPNKLFEYVVSGLPIICLNASEPAEFVLEHDIGVVINDPAEIPGIYHLHEEKAKNVAKIRENFYMESQVPKIVNLYERLVK